MLCRTPHATFFFFFNDTATTEIYTLSLHDALPICSSRKNWASHLIRGSGSKSYSGFGDRKSTRLNSSHSQISYAVFCLKKKKQHCVGHRQFSASLHEQAASRSGSLTSRCCLLYLLH